MGVYIVRVLKSSLYSKNDSPNLHHCSTKRENIQCFKFFVVVFCFFCFLLFSQVIPACTTKKKKVIIRTKPSILQMVADWRATCMTQSILWRDLQRFYHFQKPSHKYSKNTELIFYVNELMWNIIEKLYFFCRISF